MELTKEQIQRIEHYLNAKNITYIDIRLEILDHIISDIETKMIKENLDFETAFYNVTVKWNHHLKETSSWYFGVAFSAPKIVIEKAKNFYKKQFLVSNTLFAFLILLAFIESKLNYKILEDTQLNSTNVLVSINALCLIIYTFLIVSNSKIKQKTIYSFILKTQSLGLFFSVISISFSGIIENVNHAYNLTLMFVIVTFNYFYSYNKHKKEIQKYKVL